MLQMDSSFFEPIQVIIFDLGAVVINIDPPRTFEALRAASHASDTSHLNLLAHPLWHEHEKGLMDDASFYEKLSRELSLEISYDQFVEKWNLLLLDIPPARIEYIRKISSRYRLYVLSNTNRIHMLHIHRLVRQEFGLSRLDDLFVKCYYSYEIGMRKPDREIYEYVLHDARIEADKTLFIDDNKDNILSASALGINCIHLQAPNTLESILQYA